jgi:hypothetical protein
MTDNLKPNNAPSKSEDKVDQKPARQPKSRLVSSALVVRTRVKAGPVQIIIDT